MGSWRLPRPRIRAERRRLDNNVRARSGFSIFLGFLRFRAARLAAAPRSAADDPRHFGGREFAIGSQESSSRVVLLRPLATTQMSKTAAQRERRGADRPFSGDVVVCPQCRHAGLEFNERWRVSLSSGSFKTVPAWVCDAANCGFFRFARREDVVLELAVAGNSASGELRTPPQQKLRTPRGARQRAPRTTATTHARRNKN